MTDLSGIPFPYEEGAMPRFPTSLQGTWVQGAFNNYSNEGNANFIKQKIDIAVAFSQQRGVAENLEYIYQIVLTKAG